MKRLILRFLGLPILLFVVISCAVITVNVYFPTEAIEEAAEKIIDEIEGEQRSEPKKIEDNRQSYFWKDLPFYILGDSAVYAGELDMNLTTPAIRSLVDSMKARNTEIMHFKDEGVIGETNDGMLDIRDIKGLEGEVIRTVKRLLKAENNDREELYRELAAANKIESSEIDRIKAIFAETHKSKARTGHWYHDDSGKWTQKK